MSELITPPLPTGSLPAAPLTARARQSRSAPDSPTVSDTVASVLGSWRDRVDRHRRRLAHARAALPSLREHSASERALTELGPIGAAAHWVR